MKFPSLKKAVLIKLLLPSLLLLPALARAETPREPEIARWSLLCIKNTTSIGLNYSIRWGDGSWVNWHVPAYSANWHGWEYAVPGTIDAPTAYIQFDSDSSSSDSWVTYWLPVHSAPYVSCEFAKSYEFQWDSGSSRFIDLLAV